MDGREGDPKGWCTVLLMALGSLLGYPVPRGHSVPSCYAAQSELVSALMVGLVRLRILPTTSKFTKHDGIAVGLASVCVF
jgi:hypothetical protein